MLSLGDMKATTRHAILCQFLPSWPPRNAASEVLHGGGPSAAWGVSQSLKTEAAHASPTLTEDVRWFAGSFFGGFS